MKISYKMPETEETEAIELGFLIVFLDKNLVYSGDVSYDDRFVYIKNPYNFRVWGTSAGLGDIANNGRLPNSVFDESTDIIVPWHSVVQFVECTEKCVKSLRR